jgi:hypothetical protein
VQLEIYCIDGAGIKNQESRMSKQQSTRTQIGIAACATGKLLFFVFLFALYLGYPSMDKAATWLHANI